MKKLQILQIILSLSYFEVIGQVNPFIAGEINDSITYFDFIPDTTLNVQPYTYTIEGLNFYLDINNDDTDDFRFKLYNSGGNSYFSTFVILIPLNDNGIAFSHYSLSTDPYGWGNDSIYTPVAKIIYLGDTINDSLEFMNETLTLCKYSWAMESYVIEIFDWMVSGEKYIAVCLNSAGECIYGWIKVSSVNTHSITIESFGLNEFPLSIENNDQIFDNSILIWPNPSDNFISIESKYYNLGIAEIQLFDLTGKVVYRKKVDLSNNFKLDLNCKWKGMYLIKIENNDYDFTKKVIIK